MYDELVSRLTPRLTRQRTNFRPNLEPGLKVAATLRHLASGTRYRDMQYAWRVPHNTLSKVVREVCEAIVGEYLDELMTGPIAEAGCQHIADEWLQRWNFTHTVGATDGKHVACKAPPNTGSKYYNYKGFFSIILLGLVSSGYRFLWADGSGNGAALDAQIYNHSELRQSLDDGNISGWPCPDPLPIDTQDMPNFIVGDAFSLRTYLMNPYSARDLSREERIFNYRLSRARRVVENAFGIMTKRFQQHHVDTVRLIVRTCILLMRTATQSCRTGCWIISCKMGGWSQGVEEGPEPC
ncbi:putative nuclease HARBI1 [Thalassophryne amazonica]|uniref:putative nuclease HARBI1 n=1 Tax=Thalassophryne amazonica TaxID=390379 RepID=UPI001471CA74|nr:putative nuclease HARBI1 [Thalassophryne amazonica]